MVILTGIDGLEIRELKFIKVDVDLSDTKDFEIQIPASEWSSDLEYKGRVFIPGTEYGGRKRSEYTERCTHHKRTYLERNA